jgi:hypothetical protein
MTEATAAAAPLSFVRKGRVHRYRAAAPTARAAATTSARSARLSARAAFANADRIFFTTRNARKS